MSDEYRDYFLCTDYVAANRQGPDAIYAVLRQAEAAMGIPDAGTTDRNMRAVAQVILDLPSEALPERNTVTLSEP